MTKPITYVYYSAQHVMYICMCKCGCECVSDRVSVLCVGNMHLGIVRSEMESKTNPDKLSVLPTHNLLSIAFYIEMQCIHPTTAPYP